MNASNEKQKAVNSASITYATKTFAGRQQTQTKAKQGSTNGLPERYTIKIIEDEEALICLEAPNLNVHIESGLSVTASVAKKSPRGTIFLDGVAQCEPFLDHERQVYNFDHHEGCVRAFTLSTCEQALVMCLKGLDLQGRQWHIFANEPDLDTILAIWIILNHARIGRQENVQRRILYALVRLEGVIDALGLELKELSALPQDLMRKIQRVIDHLRSEEITLKKDGRWDETDYLLYTASMLHKIDQIVYKASDFADFQGIEELARIDLSDQRIAAVVEADMGIYEIEPHLNKLYGNQLGVVFLKKGPNTYTVRQLDMFMPITLEDVYERLNFIDPAVKYCTKTNKWGGAADIGGSPRETGTQLMPADLAQACSKVVRKPHIGQQFNRFLLTTALLSLNVLCAYLVRWHWQSAQWLGGSHNSDFLGLPEFGFILSLIVTVGVSLGVISYSRPWQYGCAHPLGRDWWAILPLAIAAGAVGGVWAPPWLAQTQSWSDLIYLGVLGMPLAMELLFRSLVHGLLAQGARIQRCDTAWFISWPNLGSSILYMVFISLLSFFLPAGQNAALPLWRVGLGLAGAGVLGLTLCMVRERSQSLAPAIGFHMVTSLVTLLIIRFF